MAPTHCSGCRRALIEADGRAALRCDIDAAVRCGRCGTAFAGRYGGAPPRLGRRRVPMRLAMA